MLVVPASTSSLSALTAVLNVLLGCASLFAVALWGCLALWTWRDIRARTSDRRIQIGSTILVASLFLGGWFVYRFLRPRQTLAEIYERSLEEESLLAEMVERQICPTCQAHVAPDFQLCPSCGRKLKQPCPTCTRLPDLHWTFCPYCTIRLFSAPLPGSFPGMPPGMPPSSMSGTSFGAPADSAPRR